MKAISSFVATILLIGFTVAVGAIISAFFMSYTRTTTAGVSSATACASGMLDVSVPNYTDTNVMVMTRNLGSINLTSVNLIVLCGSSSATQTTLPIPPGGANITTVSGLSGCSTNPITVSATGYCQGGGTTTTSCTGTGCRSY